MPTYVWLLIWAVVIATVAFFVILERRSANRRREDHEQVRHSGERAVRSERVDRSQGSFDGFGGF